MSAKQECLAANAQLTRLLRAAGGTDKLRARWDDSRLNDLSAAVMNAREAYTMVCFYGPKPFEQAGQPLAGSRDADHERALQILAEIR